MSVTFTKLFSDITASTIWCEPDRTRLVWITMLAMADRKGRVWASIPGLAHLARVPIEDCQIALDSFLAPDRHSRTKDEEGRRVQEIDGGWQLINYLKYREIQDQENVKESKRNYINKRRAKEKQGITIHAKNVEVNAHSRSKSIQAEAEAEADEEAVPKSTQGF